MFLAELKYNLIQMRYRREMSVHKIIYLKKTINSKHFCLYNVTFVTKANRMDSHIEIIKGIHPGKLIERELKKKDLTQRNLAEETGVPYQTINAIIAGRRNLTTEQALKIDHSLNYEEGFLAILQTYYDIKQYKEKELTNLYPEAPSIRKSVFWDSDFGKINWGKYKKAVIQRVLERGNADEISEIKEFYNLSTEELEQYKPTKTQLDKLSGNIKD